MELRCHPVIMKHASRNILEQGAEEWLRWSAAGFKSKLWSKPTRPDQAVQLGIVHQVMVMMVVLVVLVVLVVVVVIKAHPT